MPASSSPRVTIPQQTPRTPEEAKNGGIKLALGTHNARSIAHAIAVLEELELPPSAVEFQALRGMADDLKLALAQGLAVQLLATSHSLEARPRISAAGRTDSPAWPTS